MASTTCRSASPTSTGPGRTHTARRAWSPSSCGPCCEGRTPKIFGDGSITRDYVYVDDVVDACIRAAERGGRRYVNIGTGVETSVNRLYDVVAQGRRLLHPARLRRRANRVTCPARVSTRRCARRPSAGSRGWSRGRGGPDRQVVPPEPGFLTRADFGRCDAAPEQTCRFASSAMKGPKATVRPLLEVVDGLRPVGLEEAATARGRRGACRRSGTRGSSWSRGRRRRSAAPWYRTPGTARRTCRAPPCRGGRRSPSRGTRRRPRRPGGRSTRSSPLDARRAWSVPQLVVGEVGVHLHRRQPGAVQHLVGEGATDPATDAGRR